MLYRNAIFRFEYVEICLGKYVLKYYNSLTDSDLKYV